MTTKSVEPFDAITFINNFRKGKDAMIIHLKNVRLSFFDGFIPVAFEDGGKKKYASTFLVAKTDPQYKKSVALNALGTEHFKGGIDAAILAVATAAWKDKAKGILAQISSNPNKFCFQDGDTKSYDGYAGCMALAAKNDKRPTIVDMQKSPLTEEDGKPYSGCYVNASVELWAQDNKWGKAIRASLRGIQFVRDGDAFSAGSIASEDEFEDLGEGAGAGEGEEALA